MKFTRSVDGISNLEAVVIHDLRQIGVKIPKIRKQMHPVVSVSIGGSLNRIALAVLWAQARGLEIGKVRDNVLWNV